MRRDALLRRLGTAHHTRLLPQPFRVVLVATGKTHADGTPDVLVLVTNRLDLDAELVALAYRYRWAVRGVSVANIKFTRGAFFSGWLQPAALQKARRRALRPPRPDTPRPFPQALDHCSAIPGQPHALLDSTQESTRALSAADTADALPMAAALLFRKCP